MLSKIVKSRVARNATALLLLQVVTYVFPLVLLPYLSRVLGVAGYGAYAFSLSIIQVACIITDYGFNLSATYTISKRRNDTLFVSNTVGAIVLGKFVLLIFVLIALVLFVNFSHKYATYRWFLVASVLPIAGITFQPIWFFQGIERMKYITLYTCLAKATYVGLVLMMVRSPLDMVWIQVANGTSQLLAAFTGMYLMRRHGYKCMLPSWSFAWSVFRESTTFFWSRAAAATYTSAGAFYLGLFGGPREVAIFAASEQIYKGIQNLYNPIIQALYPSMANRPNFTVFFRVLVALCAMTAVGSAILYSLSSTVIRMIYGAQFVEAQSALRVFAITLVVTVPSMMLGYPFLGAMGRADLANWSVMVAGVLQLTCLAGLYWRGMASALPVAVTICGVELVVLAMRAWFGRRQYPAFVQ